MYSEQDFTQAKLAFKRFLILYLLSAIVLIGVIVAALVFRVAWLLYLAACVLALASVFLWGNFGVRLAAWKRFLGDMECGLEHEVEGVLSSIEQEDSQKDGMEFRALRLMTGETSDKAGGRLVYIDSTRLPLQVSLGQKIKCTLYGNYIKEIKASEEE